MWLWFRLVACLSSPSSFQGHHRPPSRWWASSSSSSVLSTPPPTNPTWLSSLPHCQHKHIHTPHRQTMTFIYKWPRAPHWTNAVLSTKAVVCARSLHSFISLRATTTPLLSLSLVGTKPSKVLSPTRLSHFSSPASRSSSLLTSFSRPFILHPKPTMSSSPVHPGHLHKCTDATLTPVKSTVLFSIADKVGALDECLAAIKAMNISLTRIES